MEYKIKGKTYDFNLGDRVVTTRGDVGVITKICKCSCCVKRGFYELVWENTSTGNTNYITITEANYDFHSYHRIGNYTFADFDLDDISRDLHNCYYNLGRLVKQYTDIINELRKEGNENVQSN